MLINQPSSADLQNNNKKTDQNLLCPAAELYETCENNIIWQVPNFLSGITEVDWQLEPSPAVREGQARGQPAGWTGCRSRPWESWSLNSKKVMQATHRKPYLQAGKCGLHKSALQRTMLN